MVKELLDKLQRGEFCEQECYGCHGDRKINFTCKTVVENFEKEVLKYYRPRFKPSGMPYDIVVQQGE